VLPTAPRVPSAGPGDHLWVECWKATDDRYRHEARSPYVERYWLTVVGPSTLWLLRTVAAELEQSPAGFTLDLAAASSALGLGYRSGRSSPIARSIERLGQFGLAHRDGYSLRVRCHLPDLNHAQIRRLPPHLRRSHLAVEANEPLHRSADHRARRLALTMAELGEQPGAIESQLCAWAVPPETARRSVQWALARLAGHPAAV
jgi:hypothetical protein